VVFIELAKEMLRTCVLRMTGKVENMLTITLLVIMSEAKNLILLLNFSPDVIVLFKEWRN
jgi:hypothetical protein